MTTAFLLSERPLVRFNEDGDRKLQEDLVVDLGVRVPELHRWYEREQLTNDCISVSKSGTTIVKVPAGLIYDGASIPWWSRPVIGSKEKYEVAAVIHDAFYLWQVPRAIADHVFWLISRSGSKSVNRARGWLGWAGLRLGGWWAYWKYQ